MSSECELIVQVATLITGGGLGLLVGLEVGRAQVERERVKLARMYSKDVAKLRKLDASLDLASKLLRDRAEERKGGA